MSTPVISVVLPTFNRAPLLDAALDSLDRQRAGDPEFEVIVVDDGSIDATPEICRRPRSRFEARYYRLRHSGISAAKNLGLFLSVAPLVFFFDDDDVADHDLLAEHVEAHRQHPQQSIAVLGHTSWSPTLPLTTLMQFITGAGGFLFSYDGLHEGARLDYTCFWGGRTSCKRAFLAQHGIFRPLFDPGIEDIELGSRLARRGLEVVYWPRARQYANRTFTFEAFCRRCEKQGISQYRLVMMNPGDARIAEYCAWEGAEARWIEWEPLLPARVKRIRYLEAVEARGALTDDMRAELQRVYQWCFLAYKTKGMIQSKRDAARVSRRTEMQW